MIKTENFTKIEIKSQKGLRAWLEKNHINKELVD